MDYSIIYPSFDPDNQYIQVDGLYWCQVFLDDGRDVVMLLPEVYEEVNKCTKFSKCTNWNCSKCYDSSFMSYKIEKVRRWMNKESPRSISRSNGNKFMFECNICNHLFKSTLATVTIGKWCRYCSNQELCLDKNCQSCHDKSFASSDKAKFWSYDLNKLTPREIFKQSNKKFWFVCDECRHTFDSNIYNITKGKWCPYCSNKKLCSTLECKKCHDKSFASSDKAKFWSYDLNKLTPREIFRSSANKYWFICDQCKHNFDIQLNNVIKGCWCQFCSNKKLCLKDDCVYCFSKSFASRDKVKCWNYKLNEQSPKQIFKSKNKLKYWFTCEKCNFNFDSTLNNITNGRWCPRCKSSKLEKTVSEFLKKNEIDHKQEHSLPNSRKRYDFLITDYNMLIECDGIQHFELVPHFNKPTETQTSEQKFAEKQEIDRHKDQLAKDNNLILARLDYTLSPEMIEHILSYLLSLSDDHNKFPREFYEQDNIYYSSKKMYEYLL